jgi:hypothetical protein
MAESAAVAAGRWRRRLVCCDRGVRSRDGYVLITALSDAVLAPEPVSLALLGTSVVGFGMIRRRQPKT